MVLSEHASFLSTPRLSKKVQGDDDYLEAKSPNPMAKFEEGALREGPPLDTKSKTYMGFLFQYVGAEVIYSTVQLDVPFHKQLPAHVWCGYCIGYCVGRASLVSKDVLRYHHGLLPDLRLPSSSVHGHRMDRVWYLLLRNGCSTRKRSVLPGQRVGVYDGSADSNCITLTTCISVLILWLVVR